MTLSLLEFSLRQIQSLVDIARGFYAVRPNRSGGVGSFASGKFRNCRASTGEQSKLWQQDHQRDRALCQGSLWRI